MNRLFQNYAILKAQWIPNNPIDTFLPFFLYTIKINKLNNVTEDVISQHFEDTIGFKINYSIMNNIIHYLYNRNVMKRENHCFNIDLSKINGMCSIDSNSINDYKVKFDILKKNFEDYCQSEKISKIFFDEIFYNFINNYDDFIFNDKNITDVEYCENGKEGEEYDFMFLEFVKELSVSNIDLFNFISNMCCGSIIEKYLSDDSVERIKTLKGVNIYIDTPVLLRILGYCSKYLHSEYEYIFNKWKKLEPKFYIFDFTYSEITSLLKSCEDWIESPDYDFSKASQLLNYFKVNNKTKLDVIEALEYLKHRLNELNIELLDTTKFTNLNDLFWSKAEEYKANITKKYEKPNIEIYSPYKKIDKNIEYDSRSIALIDILNENRVSVFSDLKHIFVTNNNCLVEVLKTKFDDYINPILNDSILSLMICNLNSEEVDNLMKLKLLAFCNEAFQPTDYNKARYIELLEQVKEKGDISQEKYVLLRNHSSIIEVLREVTRGNYYELREDSINEIADKVTTKIAQQYVADIEKKYRDEKILLFKNEYNKYISKIWTLILLLDILFIVISAFTYFSEFGFSNKAFRLISIICTIIVFIITALSVICKKYNLKFLQKICRRILKKKSNLLKDKYKINFSYDPEIVWLKKIL